MSSLVVKPLEKLTLRQSEVCELYGCDRKTLMRGVKAGTVPKPLKRTPFKQKLLWSRAVIEEALNGQGGPGRR